MKKCFKCKEHKPRQCFYRHSQMADGRLGKCKECTKIDVVNRRKEKPEEIREYERLRNQTQGRKSNALRYQKSARLRNPEKYRARVSLNNAVRDGRVLKLPCNVCGSLVVEGHHRDYRKPLDVVWLCKTHHLEEHRAI